jgi:hypothetical protein
MLFVRSGKVVVVDHLVPLPGKSLPEVQWLLQVPKPPTIEGQGIWTSNGKSWLRCRTLSPGGSIPTVESAPVNTHRVSFRYKADGPLTTVHVLETGDGPQPGKAAEAKTGKFGNTIEVTLDGETYIFSTRSPYAVTMQGRNPSG